MEEQRSKKIIVQVDQDLADLIPGYLSNRRADIVAINKALETKDMDTIRIIGHSLKGSGGGYGFETITDIGRIMEKAAKENCAEDISLQLTRLEDYLNHLEITFV